MYIRIRPADILSEEKDLILHVCKNTYIAEIEENIMKKWPCPGFQHMLIYKGKQLSPHYRIISYDIQVNDVILLSLRPIDISKNICPNMVDVDSDYYKTGDLVDVRCDSYFCWWSGVIVGIKKHEWITFTKDMLDETVERKFTFYVRFDNGDKRDQIYITSFDSLRPRSKRISFNDVRRGDVVLIKCCWWSCVGLWYDFLVNYLDVKEKTICGSLALDPELPAITNMKIVGKATIKLYKVDTNVFPSTPVPYTHLENVCDDCYNKINDRCHRCGCYICAGKNDPGAIILCDECDKGYHYYCLDPPLSIVPKESEWYCPNCINIPNIIVVGVIPEIDKKQIKRNIVYEDDDKVWGRGMACVGRSKECTIVPLHHFGPIPGVDVGVRWKFRIQASEAGVHRPPVAGIHGRDNDGAYSLVMSGGYEDDVDKGIEFIYSGSGGRDLSGNKRTAEQSRNQELTRNNKALALNCNAKFNNKIGAISDNWKKGKPVRVCRSSKFARYSKYAPKDGIRYDGIYKVVKYYKEKGKSGYFVWKYLLRRDDPIPAPWEKGGHEYDIIYPEGYLDAQEVKLSSKGESSKQVLAIKERASNKEENVVQESSAKAKKSVPPVLGPNEKGKGKSNKKSFKLEPKVEQLIKSDILNKKSWEECATNIKLGKFKYTLKVQEVFRCIVCQEVVFNPITTSCKHNTCMQCLKRSFEADIFECPYCRKQLGENYRLQVNKKLSQILQLLLPGYAQYR